MKLQTLPVAVDQKEIDSQIKSLDEITELMDCDIINMVSDDSDYGEVYLNIKATANLLRSISVTADIVNGVFDTKRQDQINEENFDKD